MTADYDFPVARGGWSYAWDHRRKPHAHPVATPAGVVLTRIEPPDHPWQRGLWFVAKFVDGDNFWEEITPPGYGIQRHEGPPDRVDTGDGGATLTGDLAWVRPDRETVAVREHRCLGHVPLGDDAYAIDWDVTIAPTGDAVLDRTPFDGTWGGYSGLALRGRDDWHDTRLLFDDGVERARVTPHRSRWGDLSGEADGRPVGACILDHPDNPAHPVPFYATCRAGAGYGDGWANTLYPSFLWNGPMTVPAGQPVRFRYRVVVHDGIWDADRAEGAWQDWCEDRHHQLPHQAPRGRDEGGPPTPSARIRRHDADDADDAAAG